MDQQNIGSSCGCFNPALVQQALKNKKSSLHKAICPRCGKEYMTNRDGEYVLCFDCEKNNRYKKIEVLGTGCAKCHKTEENIKKALDELGLNLEVTKVADIDQIMEYGVMITPAVVINGEVKIAGKVPSVQKIKEWLG